MLDVHSSCAVLDTDKTRWSKHYLTEGANIEEKSNFGQTLLMSAAGFGHDAVGQTLLGRGADIEAKDNDGHPSCMLLDAGTTWRSQTLLGRGTDIEAKDHFGWSYMVLDTDTTQWSNIA
jgi:hypothetical protein